MKLRNLSLSEWIAIYVLIFGCTIGILSLSYMSNMDDMASQRDFMMMDMDSTQLELTIAQDEVSELQIANEQLKEELVILEDQIHAMRKEIGRINMEVEDYMERFSNSFHIKYNPTQEELDMLYRIVEAEATGHGLQEKINVAHVIINRVYSNKFPNTVEEVIFQDRQFSPVSDGRYESVELTHSTIDAVSLAIKGEDTTCGSLYFMQESASDSDNVSWFKSKLEFVMRDGSGHTFWK